MSDFLKNMLANGAKTTAPVTTAAPVTAAAVPPVTNPLANLNLGAKPALAATTTGADLGGGNRLDYLKNAMKTASAGGKRNDIPLGEGWYLLKNGKFMVTERSSTRLSQFSFICIKAIKDKDGLAPGTQGYTGAIVGEEYSAALFQDGDFAVSGNLAAIRASMGWTLEKVKAMQKTEEGVNNLIELMTAFTGLGPDGVTGQPCVFSNQIILQMSSKVNRVDVKVNGEPTFNAAGEKATKQYTNIYWDRRIKFAEIEAEIQNKGINPEFLIKAFGSKEAINNAVETEKQLDALG